MAGPGKKNEAGLHRLRLYPQQIVEDLKCGLELCPGAPDATGLLR